MIPHWAKLSPLALVVFASVLSAQSSALDEGVQLIREHRFDEALVKLEQAHRIAPRNATIENLLRGYYQDRFAEVHLAGFYIKLICLS